MVGVRHLLFDRRQAQIQRPCRSPFMTIYHKIHREHPPARSQGIFNPANLGLVSRKSRSWKFVLTRI